MADDAQHTARRTGPKATTAAPRIEHAVVIGASIAGLLAARVLSDSYERVTIIDRDALPSRLGENRRAVPQGFHAHAMQPGGQLAIEQLLPGFHEETLKAGAPPLRFAADMRIVAAGHPILRAHIGSDYAICSRPLLESLVRRRVQAIANVAIRDSCTVLGLTCGEGRVIGMHVRDGASGEEQTLASDLVVAASGRGARVPGWLESMGYERPAEERVGIDVLYSSRLLRLRAGVLGADRGVLNGSSARRPRGMALVAEEDGRWNLTLQGYGAAHRPPTDAAGFNAFVATVAEPHALEAIEQAETLGPIASYAFPASLRRRYDRLRRFPDGLLVIGDALCNFNPIYGQGMSVAAFEAVALQRCLGRGGHDLPRRFFKAAAVPVDHAWKLANSADVLMPGVEGHAGLPDRLAGRYVERLMAVASHDERVARTFLEVIGMLAAPTRMLRPMTALRVLRGGRRRNSRAHFHHANSAG
jgi:2-polyprenyl-6-methoxyphenol hydroxylase-like FAD-dependent oxidoreductase